MLTSRWDTILWNEYNLPKPPLRKQVKRRMLFELFAVEGAVAEKFFLQETAVGFADMRPNADGTLSAFCIEQLTDVVVGLQRHVDLQNAANAMAHGFGHNPPTSAHVFQMKTVLAQLHGSGLDHHTFVGPPLGKDRPTGQSSTAAAGPSAGGGGGAAAAAAGQGRRPEPTNLDDLDEEDDREAEASVAAAEAAAAAEARRAAAYGMRDGEDLTSPKAVDGTEVCDVLQTRPMMQNGMTRRECGKLAERLEIQRQARAEYSRRLEKNEGKRVRSSDLADTSMSKQMTKVFQDGVDSKGKPLYKVPATGRMVGAATAAACVMPTAQDALSGGISDQFLRDMVLGKESGQCGPDLHMLGILSAHPPPREWDHETNQMREVQAVSTKGWDYECTSNKTGARGPADYDFNWAMLNEFTRGKKDDEGDAVGAKRKAKSIWTNVTRQIRQCVRTSGGQKTFSLMDIESMTFESMRDTLFMISQPLETNKVRIGKFHFPQRQIMMKQSRLLSGNEQFGEDDAPAKVHPQGLYTTKNAAGEWRYDPGWVNAEGLPRLSDGDAAPSDYQKRLDYFADRRALASCVTPMAFARDFPIKESEAHNAIYFNKWIANEHAALVVEAASFLARVPGIAGGDYTKVPATFRKNDAFHSSDPNAESSSTAQPHRDDDDDDEEAAAANGGGADGPSQAPNLDENGFDRDDPDPEMVQQDEMAPEPEPEPERAYQEAQEQMDDGEEDCDDSGKPLPSEEVDEQMEGMDAVERDVSEPGSEGTGLHARPGAAAASAAMSVDEDAPVQSLPFDWEMLAMFLTFKLIDTLHNDCASHVDQFARMHPDVFGGEDRETTLRDLQQICTPFPALKYKVQHSNLLFPLTRPVPLVPSRMYDLAAKANEKKAPDDLVAAALSAAHGRHIDANSDEAKQHDAESRGVEGGSMVKGNLFARSTWLAFTANVLRERGMDHEDELYRLQDHGLGLLPRVQNARACNQHEDRCKWLQGEHPLVPQSFEAQERRKRMRLDDARQENEAEPAASADAPKAFATSDLHKAMLEKRAKRGRSV